MQMAGVLSLFWSVFVYVAVVFWQQTAGIYLFGLTLGLLVSMAIILEISISVVFALHLN
jgi:hypothetical protein